MTFSADTALLIFGGVALFGFMFFILAMSEEDTAGKRSITGNDLAWLLFSVLTGYAFSTAIIFGNAVFIHWGITHWYGGGDSIRCRSRGWVLVDSVGYRSGSRRTPHPRL